MWCEATRAEPTWQRMASAHPACKAVCQVNDQRRMPPRFLSVWFAVSMQKSWPIQTFPTCWGIKTNFPLYIFIFFKSLPLTILPTVFFLLSHFISDILEKYRDSSLQPCIKKLNKIMWYWHAGKHINKWNTVESPEISFQVHGQMVFQQGCHNHLIEKESLLIK